MILAKPSVIMAVFLLLETYFTTKIHCSNVRNLEGKKLRVVTGHVPPVISILRNSSGSIVGYSGLLYHQLLYLSKSLKFTFDIFPSKENTNGVKQNGTWNGVIGTLLRHEADLGLVPVAINLERYEAIEFCGPVGGDYTGILVRYPEPSISFTGAIDVFSTGIWACWIFSGVGITVIFIALKKVEKRLCINVDETSVSNVGNVAWHLFGTMVSQGNYISFRQSTQQILAASWCLVAFVFVNIYSSTLTSYMSVTYQRPTINSFYDLAFNPSYKATVRIGSIQEIDLLRSSIEVLKIVSDRIQKCATDCRKFSSNEMADIILNKDNYVSIMPTSVAFHFVKQYNYEKNKCCLAVANEKLSWQPMFFAVPKSSPYIEEINRESLWFYDVGLHDYWYGIHEKLPKQCQLSYNSKGVASKRSSNRIKLEQFYFPFLVLFGGYLFAFVQFSYELLCGALRLRKLGAYRN